MAVHWCSRGGRRDRCMEKVPYIAHYIIKGAVNVVTQHCMQRAIVVLL